MIYISYKSSVMSTGEPKTTVTAAVSPKTKERLKQIAAKKRWTVSQTLSIFIEEFLDTWEGELGVTNVEPTKRARLNDS
jgi:hypothetical protein